MRRKTFSIPQQMDIYDSAGTRMMYRRLPCFHRTSRAYRKSPCAIETMTQLQLLQLRGLQFPFNAVVCKLNVFQCNSADVRDQVLAVSMLRIDLVIITYRCWLALYLQPYNHRSNKYNTYSRLPLFSFIIPNAQYQKMIFKKNLISYIIIYTYYIISAEIVYCATKENGFVCPARGNKIHFVTRQQKKTSLQSSLYGFFLIFS